MKLFILSAFALAMTSVSAVAARPAADRTVEFTGELSTLSAEVQDGETVRVYFPFVEKAEPRATVSDESLIYQGRCEVLGVENEAPKAAVLLKMPSTVADSGFNGCSVTIDRGFASDDSDLLKVDYGYTILD